jgi:PAS domain S-box-containing protein
MSTINEKEFERLRDSEEKYRKMFQRANDGIFAIDIETARIIEVNPKAAEMTGYNESELLEMMVWDIHPEDELEATKALFERVSSTGSGTCLDLHFLTRSGDLLAVDVSASVIDYGDKKVIQRICRDVTERRQFEDELEKANSELERKVEERTLELQRKQALLVHSEKMAALGQLVAGVAHEINTPLGALKSNNDLLIRALAKLKNVVEAPETPSEIREDPGLMKVMSSIEDLNSINKCAMERIVTIVRSLRKFARLDKAEEDQVDLHEGLESTLTLVHHELKNRIEVHKNFGDLPPVKCFPNQINQVFMNILVNASQAIAEKGDIYVDTYTRSGNAVVEIRDTGKGIPNDQLERIFDPGFTTKGVGVGTGLGLSIVHQIVADHNGSIEVSSEVGKGTTFRIILPIR